MTDTRLVDTTLPGGHIRFVCNGQHTTPYCQWCDGGLVACRVCFGSEGALPTECPGVMMTHEQRNDVYREHLDFVNGAWVEYWWTCKAEPYQSAAPFAFRVAYRAPAGGFDLICPNGASARAVAQDVKKTLKMGLLDPEPIDPVLAAARGALVAWRHKNDPPDECTQCHGSGVMQRGQHQYTCEACGGVK